MLRLVAYAPDGVRRFPIHRNELIVGSWPECDICLPYAGVAQRHARILFDGTELRIEDLGTRKGLLVSGRKVREASLEVLDEIRVGGVTLLVEDVLPTPEKPPAAVQEEPADGPPRITSYRMIEHLNRISDWVLADVESRTTSESLVSNVLADFGGGALFLLMGEMEGAGLRLVVTSDPTWLAGGEALLEQLLRHREETRNPQKGGSFLGELGGAPAWIFYQFFVALDRDYTLLVALPRFDPQAWSPAASLSTLAHLLVLGLVHHVGWYEPILPGHPGQQDLTLDPGLVVGESQAMKQVVEQLRAAVDPPVHVLLCGEPGVGKDLLARSLHLSGPRRNGPFVVTTCAGAKPQQLEADLFGAEIPGKGGPVRREGKLLLANGGTLFLDEIEQLPMDLQARLVRFLRSGQVEPAGSNETHPVEVRLVVGSRNPLDSAVARDLFRVDLAYRLSQTTIQVPPLRERREDLPLLIQSYINRFCHETGKRLQGITVKAMSALLSYDYPGNLAELENTARQLVYMAPAGRPVDVNLLPERVRNGTLAATTRVDAASDLELERLVSNTEQAAIREALRRTNGNKSHAARLLGLSRNGLAIKMERLGVKG
ncbi:MAG TPA: sigma 54-interacting transcriptional regulator [Thermoanaerobaculia bacterium]|jgi:transcriptional regulator with AAA-type ATPase domain|nr:sigma 54-interacting transcriptional regulator [Thermoanaerobaculia bacterium]